MSLRTRISDALKTAMKAKEGVRVSTLRLVQAAIKDRDIAARSKDQHKGCEEAEILEILAKMVKQREESASVYENAGRLDLSERERAEIEVISEFLPKQMSEEEIEQAARDVVNELDAVNLKDMGKCMGLLKKRHAGSMDFAKAGAILKGILG